MAEMAMASSTPQLSLVTQLCIGRGPPVQAVVQQEQTNFRVSRSPPNLCWPTAATCVDQITKARAQCYAMLHQVWDLARLK